MNIENAIKSLEYINMKAYFLNGKNEVVTARTFKTEIEAKKFCQKRNKYFSKKSLLADKMWACDRAYITNSRRW